MLVKDAVGISPTETFFRGGKPIIYTGTAWKFSRNSEHLKKFARLSKEKSWGRDLPFEVPLEMQPQQLAVPAVEPNEFINQHALMGGKADNQVRSLRVALDTLAAPSEDVIIPADLFWLNVEGGVIGVLSSDVGVRELSSSQGKWEPRRNFYLKKKELRSDQITEDQLRAEILGYYANVLGTVAASGELVRAIDSALALTIIKFDRKIDDGRVVGSARFPYDHLVFPANSTVGAKFEQHPLADERSRNQFLDMMIAKGKVQEKSPVQVLRGLHNIAGAGRVEDLYYFAKWKGRHAEILADNSDGNGKEATLIDHVKGAPYALLQALLLTLAQPGGECGRRASEDFLLQIYPKGKKGELRIY